MQKKQKTYPWGDTRRFNSTAAYYRRRFGKRIQKLSVDAGFTCPNRDGARGRGGCTYCNNRAFNPSYCTPEKSIHRQLEEGIEFHARRYRRTDRYLAYFQAFSNTYAPVETLERLYRKALELPEVEGIVISTRPDCLETPVLDLLETLKQETFVAVEIGIESCYDKTLRRINRGHTFRETVTALNACSSRGIRTTGHLIFGLPGESREEMMAESSILSGLPLTALKFHQLQIVKGTRMARDYKDHPEQFPLFSREEYVTFMISFLERLNPDIEVDRLTGESPPGFLIAPDWGRKRAWEVLEEIEAGMAEKDTWQGKAYVPSSGAIKNNGAE